MYRFWKYTLVWPLMKLFIHPKIEGVEQVPQDGRALLVCNHPGTWDPILLGYALSRQIHFVAKQELFTKGGSLRHRIVVWVVSGLGQVAINRDAADLGPVQEVLESEELVGIFPEGTRSVDGRLYRAKTGAARLALQPGVKVIPACVEGTHKCKLMPFRPKVKFGSPVDYQQWVGQTDDRELVRWVADDIAAQIQKLSGQEYVDVYASKVKYGQISAQEADAAVLPDPHHQKALPSTAE